MAPAVSAFGIVGVVFAVIGTGLLGTSMGTVRWQTPPGTNVTIGLFELCNQTCSMIGWSLRDDFHVTLIVTRSILASVCVLLLVSWVITLTVYCDSGDIKFAGRLHTASGLGTLIGCAVYTAMMIGIVGYRSDNIIDGFGYSFYLCWGAGPPLVAGGLFESCGRKSSSNSQVNPVGSE